MAGQRKSAVERYAESFDRESPELEPTDANMREVFTALPHRLYEPVRRAVKELRARRPQQPETPAEVTP